jgi:hypothetical protein
VSAPLRPLLAEPAAREKKPEASDLPPAFTQQLEKLVQSRIKEVSFAFGGLSVSAAFIFTLENTRKIFVKGAHPGDTAHAAKNLEDEIKAYETVEVLGKIAPRYIGLVSAGQTDGWMLGVWEHVEHDPALASPARVIDSLKGWQKSGTPRGALPAAKEHNYISQLLSPGRKWMRVSDEAPVREKFLSLFVKPGEAKAWLDKNIRSLCLHQTRAAELEGDEGLVHGDLRIDNFLFGAERTWVIDWPNACIGLLSFDLAFLFSNMEALGFGRAEDFLNAYSAAGCTLPPQEEQAAVLCALSGYFADQAYRAEVDKMPRLRWMQRSMLLAQLRYLARLGLIESPPAMNGENQ